MPKFEEDASLSVTKLTELIRKQLEENFSILNVEGEISNCRPASSGHLYFSLKDANAKIDAVMFKNRLSKLDFIPKDGLLVKVAASLSVYAPRGSYSLVCEEMQEAGSGDILAALEKLKKKLAEEGLFDSERKKPIPKFPKTIAVITSPTGAALRDILNILQRRSANVKVVILPAIVQGIEAAPVIANRIKQANAYSIADIIIVGRGGGSLEDLLPFSDETVVRAIASSKIPVISAVGHETDFALSDFAADLRAPTPSAAAELASANYIEVLQTINQSIKTLEAALSLRLQKAKLALKPFTGDELEYRFRSILQPRLVRFDDAKESLLSNMDSIIKKNKQRKDAALAILQAASPVSIMERGFSIVVNRRTGAVIKGVNELKKGDSLEIKPLNGKILAVTEEIYG